ncbi:hypothetical protein Tco_0921047 [Tanacetum coccineum]
MSLIMERDPTCPLLIGRGFLATASAVIDYRKATITVGEGITRSIFGVKEIDLGDEDVPYWTTLGKRESYEPRPSTDDVGARPPYYAKKYFMDYHLPREWEIARDAKLNPFKGVLVFRKMLARVKDLSNRMCLVHGFGRACVGLSLFLEHWHLEEIHVTWTQFGKKRDKIATLHEDDENWHTVRGDGVTNSCDGVKVTEHLLWPWLSVRSRARNQEFSGLRRRGNKELNGLEEEINSQQWGRKRVVGGA